jgi:hypothetical protein
MAFPFAKTSPEIKSIKPLQSKPHILQGSVIKDWKESLIIIIYPHL